MGNISDFSDLYEEFTTEGAEQTLDKAKSGGDFFKVEDINKWYRVRIAPAERGASLPWAIVSRHFYQLPGHGIVSHNCPRLMSPKGDPLPCPSCNKAAHLLTTGNAADVKLSEDLNAGTRAYCKLIDRADEEAGIQIFEFGVIVLRKLAGFREAAGLNSTDFTHPTVGADIGLKRFKATPWYEVEMAREPSRMSGRDEQIREWLNASNDNALERFMRVPTFDEIVALVQAKQEGGSSAMSPASGGQPDVVSGRTAQDTLDGASHVEEDIPF